MRAETEKTAAIPRLFRDVVLSGTQELPKRRLIEFLLGVSMEIAGNQEVVFWFDAGTEVSGQVCLKAARGKGGIFQIHTFQQRPQSEAEEGEACKSGGYRLQNEERGTWCFQFAPDTPFRYLRLYVKTGKASAQLKSLDYEAVLLHAERSNTVKIC